MAAAEETTIYYPSFQFLSKCFFPPRYSLGAFYDMCNYNFERSFDQGVKSRCMSEQRLQTLARHCSCSGDRLQICFSCTFSQTLCVSSGESGVECNKTLRVQVPHGAPTAPVQAFVSLGALVED